MSCLPARTRNPFHFWLFLAFPHELCTLFSLLSFFLGLTLFALFLTPTHVPVCELKSTHGMNIHTLPIIVLPFRDFVWNSVVCQTVPCGNIGPWSTLNAVFPNYCRLTSTGGWGYLWICLCLLLKFILGIYILYCEATACIWDGKTQTRQWQRDWLFLCQLFPNCYKEVWTSTRGNPMWF